MQVAGVPHHPTISNRSVWCCLFVYQDELRYTTAELVWLLHIRRKFLECKDVCWCLSQHNLGILHETDAINHFMLYSLPNYSHFVDSQNTDFALFKMIKGTNLDIKDAACLHIAHILQHPTSCPTRKSTQTTMVKTPKKSFSPVPAGIYGKST